jgi:hypothetical protein
MQGIGSPQSLFATIPQEKLLGLVKMTAKDSHDQEPSLAHIRPKASTQEAECFV